MKTIWKFPLTLGKGNIVAMAAGAEILKAGLDPRGELCLWALVDDSDSNSLKLRVIDVFGTGHRIPEGQRKYIGTVTQGEFVWHVFEELRHG